VPTVGEFTPGYEAILCHGIGAPKNTPAEIVDKLNNEINAVIANPRIKARLLSWETWCSPLLRRLREADR